MTTEIVEVEGFEDSSLKKLYANAFPAVERRPIEKLNEMIKNDENNHLYIIKEDSLAIGFALVYEFVNEKIVLLDYMVIKDTFQKRGMGSKLLQYCIDSIQSRGFLGLLLEIQLEDENNSDEQKIRGDRIRFYKKFGAKTFENVEYYIPPQVGDAAERMYLMMIPFNGVDSFPKKVIENLVRKMHLEIYHSKRMDLVEKTAQSLSENVKLV